MDNGKRSQYFQHVAWILWQYSAVTLISSLVSYCPTNSALPVRASPISGIVDRRWYSSKEPSGDAVAVGGRGEEARVEAYINETEE